MVFIIGGYASGQKEYALEHYGEDSIIFEDVNELISCKGLSAQEAFNLVNKEAGDKDQVVIGVEVGNGIVPLEQSDRLRRDEIGQLHILLAESAQRVVRMVCGIGQIIK